MKCKNWIPKPEFREGKWKKNKVYEIGHLTAEEVVDWQHQLRINLVNHEICGGNLVAHVEANLEPEWGGQSANLEVYFTCDKCGSTIHRYLPDEYNIEEFLTKVVEDM